MGRERHVVVSRARGDAAASVTGANGGGEAANAGQARALWALPFDLDRLEATGEAVPVREGVRGYSLDSGSNSLLVSTRAYLAQDETLAYIPADRVTNERTLVWVSQDGGDEPIAAPPRPYQSPRISPDGTRVAMMVDGDIWIHDLVRGGQIQLTFYPGFDGTPIWHVLEGGRWDRSSGAAPVGSGGRDTGPVVVVQRRYDLGGSRPWASGVGCWHLHDRRGRSGSADGGPVVRRVARGVTRWSTHGAWQHGDGSQTDRHRHVPQRSWQQAFRSR